MIFRTACSVIETDEQTGETRSIRCTDSNPSLNYVLSGKGWGTADGFHLESTETQDGCLTVCYRHPEKHLLLTVKRYVQDGDYWERYTLTNSGAEPFRLERDTFGIRFPYTCYYARGSQIVKENTMSHIWCAEDTAYIKTEPLTGEGKHLWQTLVSGRISDYSIHYPADLPLSFYRGIFVLHPAACVLKHGQSIDLLFRFRFSDDDTPPCDIVFRADKYSLYQGEEVSVSVTSKEEMQSISLSPEVPVIRNGHTAFGKLSFADCGEKKVSVTVNGKTTHLFLQVIPNIDDILLTRAAFIAKKQQCHAPLTPLDGAYLIYDREQDAQYCSSEFIDHNACRERLSMGVVMACALQKRYDATLYRSLQKHREFVEREIFDRDSATVYNDVGRNNSWERLYNYPWLSTYYLEWYIMNGEETCLNYAARILLRYYEVLDGKKQESVCMETYRILQALKTAGMKDLYQRLYAAFLSHAEDILRRAGESVSDEVSWANGMVSAMVQYLSQAYLLSGEEKYLSCAKRLFRYAKVFFSDQPDFHLNGIAVRYWDGFWFGKVKAYGDTLPQWLSSLSGLMCYWYQKASGEDLSSVVENNLKGALCLYDRDGFAASCYLYPCFVTVEENNRLQNPNHYLAGVHLGKRYDGWANDQDWSLYYAFLFGRDNDKEETDTVRQ